MAQSYSVTAVLSAVDRGFSSTMDKAATATKSLGSTVQEKMGGIGKAVTIAGAATTAMGVSALKSYGSFKQSLNQAAVIAGGTAKDIDGLADVANRMGAELPLSAQDAADAMVAMARDGASIGTIKKEFPAIAKAATAAGADLQTTASVVQQSMNIWGDSLKSPEQAAGILVSTANMSNASIESMQQALATMGPTATMTGMDMQTVATAIGLLTNKGFSAAQASDDLNHAILQMAAPSKVAKGAMEDLGISYRDAEGNMKPFPQILSEVAEKTDGLGKAQKDAALKALFGTAGMKAILPLLDSVKDKTGNTATSWDAFTKAMDEAAGTTEKANKTLDKQAVEMQKNVGSKIEQLGGNWESLRNKAMDSQSKVTGSMLDMANTALDWAGKSDSSTAKVIRGFIGLSPAIGPAMTAAGGFLTNAQKIGNVAGSAVKGLEKLGSGAVNLASKMTGINLPAKNLSSSLDKTGGSAGKATSGLNQVSKASSSVDAPARASSTSLLAIGTAALKIGVGIGVATAGMAALVFAIAQLSKEGMQGIITLGAVTVAIGALAGVFALLGPPLTAGAVGIGVFGAAVLGIGIGIGAATAGIAALITALNNFNMTGAQVVAILSAIGTGFAMMITNFLGTLAENMPKIALSFVQMFITIQQTVLAHLPEMISNGIKIILALLDGLTQGIPQIVAKITEMMIAIFDAIGNNAPQIVASFAAMCGQLLAAMVEISPLVLQVLVAALVGMLVAGATFAGKFQDLGGVLFKALEAGLTSQKYDVVGEATKIIQSAGQEASKNGIAAFDAAGGNSAISSLKALGNKKGEHKSKGADLANAAAEGIKSKNGTVKNAGSDIGRAGADGVKSKTGDARNSGSDLGKAGADGARSQRGAFNSAGSFIAAGLSAGINAMSGNVMGVAASLASKAASAIKAALKIHSPSRVTKEFGMYFGLGFINGISGMEAKTKKTAENLAQASMFSIPPVNTHDFVNSIAAMNGQLTGSISGDLTRELSINQQSAYINVSLGGTDYSAFVEDISREQGSQASLTRNYKF